MREQAALLTICQTLASTMEFEPGLTLDRWQETVDYAYAALFELEYQELVALAVRLGLVD